MDEKVKDYIVDLVFATRKPEDYQLDTKDLVQYGASPRATIFWRRRRGPTLLSAAAVM